MDRKKSNRFLKTLIAAALAALLALIGPFQLFADENTQIVGEEQNGEDVKTDEEELIIEEEVGPGEEELIIEEEVLEDEAVRKSIC